MNDSNACGQHPEIANLYKGIGFSLIRIAVVALTVACRFHSEAKAGLRIHVRSSSDGMVYDTEDVCVFDLSVKPEHTARKTVGIVCRTIISR